MAAQTYSHAPSRRDVKKEGKDHLITSQEISSPAFSGSGSHKSNYEEKSIRLNRWIDTVATTNDKTVRESKIK